MFQRLYIWIKIKILESKICSIETDLYSYYMNLNYKNVKYFGGFLDIEKEFKTYRKPKDIQIRCLRTKINDLKLRLEIPEG